MQLPTITLLLTPARSTAFFVPSCRLYALSPLTPPPDASGCLYFSLLSLLLALSRNKGLVLSSCIPLHSLISAFPRTFAANGASHTVLLFSSPAHVQVKAPIQSPRIVHLAGLSCSLSLQHIQSDQVIFSFSLLTYTSPVYLLHPLSLSTFDYPSAYSVTGDTRIPYTSHRENTSV